MPESFEVKVDRWVGYLWRACALLATAYLLAQLTRKVRPLKSVPDRVFTAFCADC
jgi:hypothetical protein